MTETRVLERLTASDLFLLQWDHHGWSSDIGGLAILDASSLLEDKGRVRIDAIAVPAAPSTTSGDRSSGLRWPVILLPRSRPCSSSV